MLTQIHLVGDRSGEPCRNRRMAAGCRFSAFRLGVPKGGSKGHQCVCSPALLPYGSGGPHSLVLLSPVGILHRTRSHSTLLLHPSILIWLCEPTPCAHTLGSLRTTRSARSIDMNSDGPPRRRLSVWYRVASLDYYDLLDAFVPAPLSPNKNVSTDDGADWTATTLGGGLAAALRRPKV